MTEHVAYPGCYCTDCVEGTPSARIMGDKDRENPVEGAPLIDEAAAQRIASLEAQLAAREPTEAMVEAGVRLAMRIQLSPEYGWKDYMRDLYRAMQEARDAE